LTGNLQGRCPVGQRPLIFDISSDLFDICRQDGLEADKLIIKCVNFDYICKLLNTFTTPTIFVQPKSKPDEIIHFVFRGLPPGKRRRICADHLG
jgi:hypothetical protein